MNYILDAKLIRNEISDVISLFYVSDGFYFIDFGLSFKDTCSTCAYLFKIVNVHCGFVNLCVFKMLTYCIFLLSLSWYYFNLNTRDYWSCFMLATINELPLFLS